MFAGWYLYQFHVHSLGFAGQKGDCEDEIVGGEFWFCVKSVADVGSVT